MKTYLASFYSSDLKRSANRFVTQAKQMNVYDSIKTFTFNDLNEDFKLYVKDLLKKGKKRGYGYWVWQTYIHQLVLSKLQEGDIYHWCDIGCHFNYKGNDKFIKYVERVKKYDSLTFEYDGKFKTKDKKLKFQHYYEYAG